MSEIEEALKLVTTSVESAAEYVIISLTTEEMRKVVSALSSLKSGEVVVVETKKLNAMLRLGCPPNKPITAAQMAECHPKGCWQCKLAYLRGDDGGSNDDET
jgi:hypothetical protein